MPTDNNRQGIRIPVSDISSLAGLIEKAKLSMADILGPLGLPQDLFVEPKEATIWLSDYFRILARLAKVAGDETFHFTSRRLMPGSTDLIMSSALGCANMLEAVKVIAKSNNLLHGEDYNRVNKRGRRLHYIIDDHDISYALDNQLYNYVTMEAVTLYIFGMLNFLSGDQSVPLLKEVHSRRPQYDPSRDVLSCLGVPVHYNASSYMLTFSEDLGSMPVAGVPTDGISKEVARFVINMVDHNSIQPAAQNKSASARVKQALTQGLVDQQDVADYCHMSVATLKRHLQREGTSFRALKDQARNEQAKKMLAKNYNVNEVAELLGFSEPRSFYRAFKSWNGLSPHAYQQQSQSSRS
ncbi:helix-turn-helix transcriptional regulator [Halioxenophilus sp. WMMB6]|uniref:helix-turn-helix transcriptional regulator n=1 Tax=Halioxenophilus sp. WMMB6 TaxID=3073815 RepID=UPI00295F2B83|nr:helix-turn-helix domain-containing protein [Halioxenophilus sp. WMMB6]